MSTSPGGGGRSRTRRNIYMDPPNTVFTGSPCEAPEGVTAWPGPRRIRRHRGYLFVRIHPINLTLLDSPLWVATVMAELPDCGIVASGPDPDALKVYLLARYRRVCFTTYDQSGHPI